MRGCAKNGCESRADATVALLYGPREVVVGDLERERDPTLLDLCSSHADKLSPPIGWMLTDRRSDGSASA